MTGFHRGGWQAYVAAVREEYDSKLRSLKEKLRLSASEGEREVVRNEVRELKAEMRLKLARIGGSLF